MLVAAAIAFWKGWQIHHGETAVLAYGLGAIALALGSVAPDAEGTQAAALIDVETLGFGRLTWGASTGRLAPDRQTGEQGYNSANLILWTPIVFLLILVVVAIIALPIVAIVTANSRASPVARRDDRSDEPHPLSGNAARESRRSG